ncbi:ubiquitin family protein [Spirosoma validum]|uniref:DUF4276 family protein n=1 Tax=Spirosoma validum TaxID=2771355 RepID=A0A927B427_9BACT|nr:hypothetical protein [Spirosoma validum]MBD2755025.1 hypothetical protein [Spirosoma validum]
MVNVGFICEGDTEVKIVKSDAFQYLLEQLSLRCIFPVEDADGNGNLLPHNILAKRNTLEKAGADKIFILTDLDTDASVISTRQRIGEYFNQRIIVAVQEAEAWFLADSATLTTLLGKSIYFDYPEQAVEPFEVIRQLFLEETGRGVGTKPILARRMIKYGFTIENAAQHPNCPSANYFLTKLQTLASAN